MVVSYGLTNGIDWKLIEFSIRYAMLSLLYSQPISNQ